MLPVVFHRDVVIAIPLPAHRCPHPGPVARCFSLHHPPAVSLFPSFCEARMAVSLDIPGSILTQRNRLSPYSAFVMRSMRAWSRPYRTWSPSSRHSSPCISRSISSGYFSEERLWRCCFNAIFRTSARGTCSDLKKPPNNCTRSPQGGSELSPCLEPSHLAFSFFPL